MKLNFQIPWGELRLYRQPELYLEAELRGLVDEFISATGEYPTRLLTNRQLHFAIITHLYHITDLKIDKGGDVKGRYVLGMKVEEDLELVERYDNAPESLLAGYMKGDE